MRRASRLVLGLAWALSALQILPAQAPAGNRAVQVRPGSPQAAAQEARIALVIGNAAYPEAPLKNPVNDARAMAQVLRKCGFRVIPLENASLQRMREALREFGGRIAQGGVGLFYFAGHGMQVKGRNYLMPVGADIRSEDEVAGAALDVDSVLAKLETARNRLNILILDACRNDPFARGFRSASRGLAPLDAPMGTFIAFATAPGRSAADGGGSHGLYTEQLLQAIQTPNLTLENTFKRVLSGVRRASNDQQIPWTASSVEGDFFFKPGAAPAAPQAAPAAAPAAAVLEGTEAQKAVLKDAFETEAEYAARLATLPPVRVGTARLLREQYDLKGQRLPVDVQVEPWAAPLVRQKKGSLGLDRAVAKALCDGATELPLVARFEAPGGLLTLVGAKVMAGTEGYALGAAPAPRPGEDWEDPVTGLAFVMIPAGSFRMGSNATEAFMSDAHPVHTVTLTQPFLMQKCPVTVAQFRAFVEATGYRTEAEQGDGSWLKVAGVWQKRGDANWRTPTFAQEDDCPVVCVSWNDAQAYLKWLNGKGGDLAFRLPTEAEWEYACRAGTEGETYDALDAIAWYDGNSGGRTHPVAQKQPNAFGLFDMLGNAWQWCQDFYDPNDYPSGPVQDPQGALTSANRVCRGRSWGNPGTEVRSSFRNLSVPGDRYLYGGFRVAAQARTP
jgi:formylglycine-generating enzyme required for sulfatase activity/uncharacterized caspase-like protein